MATKVTHSSELFEPFTVYVMYAPASAAERINFLQRIDTNFQFDRSPDNRCILMGDFKHNLYRDFRHSNNIAWHQWIQNYWYDPIHADASQRQLPTYRNISTIDFLLVSNDLRFRVSQPKIQYVTRCDHSAVSVIFTLVQDKKFRRELYSFCDIAVQHLPTLDTPERWDRLKVVMKGFVQNYTHKASSKTQRQQNYLHKQRTALLRQSHNENAIDALKHVESQLDQIANSSASTLALRSGLRWRENGEQSNSYFYRTIRERQQKQAIHELQSSEGHIVRSTQQLNNCTKQFYEKLYSTEPIQQEAVDELLDHIPSLTVLDENTASELTSRWTEEEITECMSKTPRRSSPGVDGIPYEILQLMLKHPFCRQLFIDVLNSALSESKFPATWQRSIVILLPKKGDRSQLKNWRPISLICADAKIFTRLLATRMKYLIPQMVDKHQTGFMPERFIADNGVTTRLIMDIAQRFKLPGIALLLDQEKAYDRVHPKYLQACLEHFGFPSSLIHCIQTLFFGTSLCINVNGFLSTPIAQARGLRQGDRLSPLLFNLAIEPLLRSIWFSRLITGFQISNSIHPESIQR